MSGLTVEVPPDLEGLLRAEAERHGVDVAQYIGTVLRFTVTGELAHLRAFLGLDGDTVVGVTGDAIDAACGAMAHVPGTVDEFLCERQEEADREMRQEQERWEEYRRGRR